MKTLIVLFGLSLTIASVPATAGSMLINEDKHFCGSSPLVSCAERPRYGSHEEGKMKGIPFYIRLDGTGLVSAIDDPEMDIFKAHPFQTWSIHCVSDDISGTVACMAGLQDLWVSLDGRGHISVSVGSKHVPGSVTQIRVGKYIYETKRDGVFSSADSKKIVVQLGQGETVVTRFTKWPSATSTTSDFVPHHFDEAIVLMRWMLSAKR